MKNVILITIDTLRRDVFGCYGSMQSLTPFMDSLQDKCLRFDRAYATGSYTQASFPGILTSSYYLEYGRQKNLPAQKRLISEVLRENGVATAAFHSNPYLSGYFGWNRGWDTFYDSMEDDVTDLYPFIRGKVINKKVETWLSDRGDRRKSCRDDSERPFFLWVHYMDVHEPYVPEEEYLHLVDPDMHLEKGEMFRLFKEVVLKRDVSHRETVDLLKKLYCAKVLEVDLCVQNLFRVFRGTGVLQNSTIIFGSDHGDEFGEHESLSHDGKMYMELIAVPLFIYDPERPASEVYAKPVSNIDVSPTIAHLLGVDEVEKFKGSSLVPLDGHHSGICRGESINKRGHKEKDEDKPVYYSMRENLKIILDEGTGAWELYDVNDDPGEKTNRIASHDRAEDMKGELLDWLKNR
jgi:arylsulfatase A-like enzyme